MKTRFASCIHACVVAIILALVVLLAGCSSQKQAQEPLKLGVIPFEAAGVIQKGFTPLATFIGQKSGRPSGQVFVTPDYAGVLQALQSDQIDAAYLSPLAYVLAVEQFRNTPEHLVPLGIPYMFGSLTYRGIVFVRTDSGIKTIKDLKGKSFAFADRTSASGYLYPAGLMKEAGLDPDKDIKPVNIGGSASVMAVYNGQADGGAIYEDGIKIAFKDPVTRKIDQTRASQMRVIATTDPIPNGMLVARANLDPKTLALLKKAIDALNTDPNGKAALAKIPDGAWGNISPPDDSMFNSVRKKAKILGLTLSSLSKK
ncbi:MAG: phosphate/phosphite/phosphonate ABC transporter substrate-binding protein [Capsulimonadaceae bacterium]|nr:phosphate/phosphite/phosphonate ABC transporter substrate-binding protein [Capsulimonadaceae bacterium]